MAEAGVFGPEERVELIRGVVRAMSPKGPRHRVAVGLAAYMEKRVFKQGERVSPLSFPDLEIEVKELLP